jgi:DNA sulfur modification protein DndD
MKLITVVFHDYRVYGGQQVIDLSASTQEKPVIVVGGLNGEGKTTMLEGIQLALYGRQSEIWSQHGGTYSTYLEQSIHRGSDPAKGALVEVEFEAIDDAELRKIRVQRTWKLNGGGKIKEYLQVFVDGQLDKLLSDNWADQVERFIPSRLAGLFFFDGEKIRHYADPRRAQELIRRGVLSLLGIDLVDQLDIDLKALESRITRSKNAIKSDKAGSQLEKERAGEEKNLKILKNQRADLQNDLDSKSKLCDDLDESYRELGGKLFEQRVELEKTRRDLMERRKGLTNQLIEVSAGSLPLTLLSEELGSVKEQIKSESQTIEAQLTSLALDEQRQRLDKHLGAQSVQKKTMALIGKFYDKEAKVLKEKVGKPVFLKCSESDYLQLNILLKSEIEKGLTRTTDLLAQINKLDGKIQALDRKLAAVPDDEAISEVAGQRDISQKELLILEGRTIQLDETIRLARNHLLEAETALNKYVIRKMEQDQYLADDARVLVHAEKVRATLKEFRSHLVRRRIQDLQDIILEAYIHLMRKKSMIKSIEIDPDSFALSLCNLQGKEILPEWLSAGERQLLVVSILWGLARASGRSLPIIVDTPLGRLDSSHRDNLVRHYYPRASHQVILLSTDEELYGKALRALKPAIGAHFRLVYDEATESTTIREGYFEEMKNAN